MTVTAQMRGHPVWHDGTVWRHTDDNTLAPASGGAERPCTHCGLTAEAGYGPDPCLGWGGGPACCGHGIEDSHRGDAQGWVDQPRPVAEVCWPVAATEKRLLVSPPAEKGRRRRATVGRLRHPVLVTLGLCAAAAVLVAGYVWWGVL